MTSVGNAPVGTAPVAAAQDARAYVSLTLYGLAFAVLAIHFASYLGYAVPAIFYPYELDYGEGIVWQQAMLMPGARMYGDITRFPFIVFHYPPLYHLSFRAIAALGVDPLVAGRGLSLLSTLAAALVAAGMAFEVSRERCGRFASTAGAAVAALGVFCCWPVALWSVVLRVDMLALALCFLGVWCAMRSTARPALIYASVLLFVLAVWTKQTCIAAPLAAVPIMFVRDRRRTLAACGLGVALSVAALLVMLWATGGRFLQHILAYNVNRYDIRLAVHLILPEWPQIFFLMLAITALVVGWRRLASDREWIRLADIGRDLHDNATVRAMAMISLYFVTSMAMLGTLGKSGGGANYLIEPMCVWAVLIGGLFASTLPVPTTPRPAGRPRSAVLAVLLPVGIIFQAVLIPATRNYGQSDPARLACMSELQTMVVQAQRPVLSDDMVLLMKAGREVPWEPSIFAELASTGRWDERRIVDMLDAHAFAFIVTDGQRGDPVYDSRYTQGVDRAITTAYPRTEAYCTHTVHLPPA